MYPNEDQPPGVVEVLDQTVLQWLFSILGWGSTVAFLVVGGIFLFAYFGGNGSERAVRSLVSVCIGCILIAGASSIAKKLIETSVVLHQ